MDVQTQRLCLTIEYCYRPNNGPPIQSSYIEIIIQYIDLVY